MIWGFNEIIGGEYSGNDWGLGCHGDKAICHAQGCNGWAEQKVMRA